MAIMKLKVHIDRDACLAYGDCAELAPEAFEVDDAAHLVGSAPLRQMVDAARACPIGGDHAGRRRDRRAGRPLDRPVARDREAEGRALTRRGLRRDRAPMRLDDRAGDRQSQPAASLGAAAALVGAVEAIEDPPELVGLDPGAVVA